MAFKNEREVSLSFLDYLEREGRQETMPVKQLRRIFEDEFKIENETFGIKFEKVLNTLSFRLNKCQWNQGKVMFGSGEEAALRMFDSDSDSDTDVDVPLVVNRCATCKRDFKTRQGYLSHLKSVRHRQQHIIRAIKQSVDKQSLKEDKQGVVVKSVPNSDENGVIELHLQSGRSGEITLIIQNNGKKLVELKDITLLWSNRFFDYKDIAKIDVDRGLLQSGGISQFKVGCRKQQEFGNTYVPAVFSFVKGEIEFHIMRFLCVRVVSDIFDALKAKSAFRGIPKPDIVPWDVKTIPGISLPKLSTNKLEMERLPNYEVPPQLQAQVFRNNQVSDAIRLKVAQDLSFANYREKSTILLHIEEIQMKKDIRTYDMKGVTFQKDGLFLVLEVPGLAENRPSVLRGDRILAYRANVRDQRYEGVVHKVEQLKVKLRFNASLNYVTGMKFDVEFTFNRLPVKLEHRACEKLASRRDMEDVLFPKHSCICTKDELPAEVKTLYDRILNKEQQKAVQMIVSGTSRPAPYLIFGPPGTGKTVTMVEAIKQVFNVLKGSVILACAPENSAADLLAERLLAHIDKGQIFRMYASSRPWEFIPQKLKDARVVNFDVSHEPFYPSVGDLQSNYRIIITTLVTAGRLASAHFPRDHFTHIFIDEAGHAVEPEAIIPIADLLDPNNPKGGQLVLAGDPKQLGPILRSPITKEHGLEISLLERLMSVEGVYTRGLGYNDKVLTKLVNNYRSHHAIIEIPKQLFYDDELNECADDFRKVMLGWEELPNPDFPIIFHPVYGKDEREAKSPSFFNVAEVETIEKYLRKLVDDNVRSKKVKHVKPEMIGIISPYKRQVQKIQTMIEKKYKGTNIKVGSVEEFQGQERRIIIVSTVRSTNREYLDMDEEFRLGFLNNPKRFNVAITRAKALLILIGNPNMLTMDTNWEQFLDYCNANKGWVDVPERGNVNDIVETLRRLKLLSGEVPDQEAEVDISKVQLHENPEWTRHE